MAKGSAYMKVLDAHKRRLGDYEQVHFRKSWVKSAYESVIPRSDTLTSASRPILQPQVLEFSRATAKPFLQQTESLWFKPLLSRHEASEELLDKRTGSFIVRNSTKAKYALSVRLPDDADSAVMHYLVYCSSNGFYGIQGSNLQFVSLYDLLAYFCFQQSGGMPCLLNPPAMQRSKNGFYLSDSDSDTEDEDEENPFSPDHTGSEFPSPFTHYETQDAVLMATRASGDNDDHDLKPPPLPPRVKSHPLPHHVHNEMDVNEVIDKMASLVDKDGKVDPVGDKKIHRYKNFTILGTDTDDQKDLPPREDVLPSSRPPPPLPPRIEKKDASKFPPAVPPKPHPPPLPPRVRHHTEQTEETEKEKGHRRAASDSSVVSGNIEEVDVSASSPPPPVPPKKKMLPEGYRDGRSSKHQYDEVKIDDKKDLEEWTMVDTVDELTSSTAVASNVSTPSKNKWKKPRWAKKLRKWRRKPHSRVKHFIIDLSSNKNSEFGTRVHYFLETVLMKGNEPHQKLLSDVRQFISLMRELLLDNFRVELLDNGMDSCKNFEHLLEATLQQCITKPLHRFLFDKLEENLTNMGSTRQLREAVENARNKNPEDLGIRSHLVVPNDKSLHEINNIFNKLKQTHCAMRKLEYLLEAVRLTYEGVKDVNNPKKSMNDLGADDFLPLFVWVLAHTSFTTAEIEAEYIWGLAHPSLFNGEGGYYLTTLTSAINVLRELCSNSSQDDSKAANIRKTSALKTELEIHLEYSDNPGNFDGPHSFPVLPTMTTSEICELIAEKFNISDPNEYALCTYINNKATPLDSSSYPQEIIIEWELQSTNNQQQFLAFMKSSNITR